MTACQAGSERGGRGCRSAKSQLNHVVGGAVREPFAIRTPSIKDDRRCLVLSTHCRTVHGQTMASVAA